MRHKPRLCTDEEFAETAQAPVWVHSRVMSRWLQIIGDWFCADRVLSGLSPLAGRKGQKVFSETLSLADGMAPTQVNLVPVDLEGVGPQGVPLVSDGHLQGLLHSSRTAAMENRPSTGHYLRLPDEMEGRIRPLSLCILPDPGGEDLLSAFDEGYTLEFLEDFSPLSETNVAFRGVGRRIHSGRPGAWVSMRSANCNLLTLMTRSVAVGKDLSLFGNFGSPSILFQEMPLSITR
ncbi:MAG: metallopeptidase TldD-related protein [Bdellovibrionota bacterium]